MIVYTDSRSYAETLFDLDEPWQPAGGNYTGPALQRLVGELYNGEALHKSRTTAGKRWRYAFVVKNASRSQYDILVGLTQEGVTLPDGIICLAGSGKEFHGQRGRPWSTLEGNIHLSVHFSPRRPIDRFHTGFSILAAVALAAAVDRFAPLRGAAAIKWVNDLLIDGAKVAGFLAHTNSIETQVNAAVLGIGLNVETTPVLRADRFVPRAASLRDFIPDLSECNQRRALNYMLDTLQSNYDTLLGGGYFTLLSRYRERSMIVGRKVRIFSDSSDGSNHELAAGVVVKIGENLELYLEGDSDPITRGRLILEGEHA